MLIRNSKVPTLWAGYFASEMNARKSLGGVVRNMWYMVVITCRGRHWAGTCRRDNEIHGTGLKALGCDLLLALFTRCRHEAEY